jgi:ribosome-associated protein
MIGFDRYAMQIWFQAGQFVGKMLSGVYLPKIYPPSPNLRRKCIDFHIFAFANKQIKSSLAKEKKAAPKKTPIDPLNQIIIDTILDKKGQNISLLDLRTVSGPTDYFIICEADNSTLTKAIADHIAKKVKEVMGILPNHTEGAQQAKWVLVDYFTTIVHIFHRETRTFYEIDQLWSDAPSIEYHSV